MMRPEGFRRFVRRVQVENSHIGQGFPEVPEVPDTSRARVRLFNEITRKRKNSRVRQKPSGTSGTSGRLTLPRVSGFVTSGLESGNIRTGVK